MKKPKITAALLDKIEKEKDFSQLENLRDPSLWKSVKETERNRLATLFLKEGENLLEKGNMAGIHSYDVAVEIASKDPKFYFHHAFVHFKYATEVEKGVESLKKGMDLDPSMEWVTVSFAESLKGLKGSEQWIEPLEEVVTHFDHWHRTLEKEDAPFRPRFFWQWGVFLIALGRNAGEPTEFHRSKEFLDKAISQGLNTPALFFDYGLALLELSKTLKRHEFLEDSIEWFSRYIDAGGSKDSFFYEYYTESYQLLFMYDKRDEVLEKGHLGFLEGSAYCYDVAGFWVRWGVMLKEAGKHKKSVPLLEESFDKFEKGAKITQLVETVLVDWAEALLLAGMYNENVDYLKESYEKLSYCILFLPDDPRVWYLLGSCLNEMGSYFQDTAHFFEAIDKFQQGLSVHRENALLWWGLALSHLSLGELNVDVNYIQRSCHLFAQATEFKPEGFPPFWNDWAVALMKLGEWQGDKEYVEAAIERFDLAIRQQVQENGTSSIEPEWVFHLGCALDFMGDLTLEPQYYEQSIQILTKALILDPDFPYCRYQLALSLTHLGEISADIECFSQALEMFEFLAQKDPEDDYVWNDWAVGLIHYADMVREPAHPQRYEDLLDGAEEKLKNALSLGNVQANYNLGCLYSIRENFEASLYYLEKAATQGAIPPLEDLLEDEWLEKVRKTEAFEQFIQFLRNSP